MLDGITVLSESTNQLTTSSKIDLIIIFLVFALIFGVIAAISMQSGWFGFGVGIFIFVLFIMLGFNKLVDKSVYSTYKVTISEEVNFKEFTNRYEILSQEGQIYEIREKETE